MELWLLSALFFTYVIVRVRMCNCIVVIILIWATRNNICIIEMNPSYFMTFGTEPKVAYWSSSKFIWCLINTTCASITSSFPTCDPIDLPKFRICLRLLLTKKTLDFIIWLLIGRTENTYTKMTNNLWLTDRLAGLCWSSIGLAFDVGDYSEVVYDEMNQCWWIYRWDFLEFGWHDPLRS